MLALQISQMKPFMNQLLAGEAFDCFLLEEAVISTANTHTIDGRINRSFFSKEELSEGCCPYAFRPWSELKGLCFHLIKGKHTPLFFKFVFQLKPELFSGLLGDNAELSRIKSLILTVKYDSSPSGGSKALLTTGTSYHTFVMTREADRLWDKALVAYLSGKEIPFDIIS